MDEDRYEERREWEQDWLGRLREKLLEDEAGPDWREAEWTRDASSSRPAFTAGLGGVKLRVQLEPSGLWYATVNDEDGVLWGCDVHALEAGQVLAILHADLSYLDMDQVWPVMAENLDEIDPDYLDVFTLEEHGWEGFVDREETCGDDYFQTLKRVVLADSSVLVCDEEEYTWGVEER